MIERIIFEIRNFSGIQRKRNIQFIINKLKNVYDFGNTVCPIGDDTGALKNGSGYLLLAAEEIDRTLLVQDPHWAGFCSVLVNVNDIYAMGGTPLAMVNTVSFKDYNQGEAVFAGIRESCEKYRVPMVGGHFSPDSEFPTLTVAIMGKARELLSGFNSREEDELIIAVDLKGSRYKNFLHWDCISDKSSDEIAHRLGALPFIAESRLAHSAKDVSNAGIIGTICMLLETSRKGGEIFLDNIPAPEGIDFIEWLKMYPSYGFILSAPPENKKELLSILSRRGYSANTVGRVTRGNRVILHYKGNEGILFDLNKDPVLGS